jgi:hypothetical protein
VVKKILMACASVFFVFGCTSMENYSKELAVEGYYYHGLEEGGYLQLCDNKEFKVKFNSEKLERPTFGQFQKLRSTQEDIPYVHFKGRFRTDWNIASADNSGFLVTQVLEMRNVRESDCKVKPMFSR